jgi:hypothetical protein
MRCVTDEKKTAFFGAITLRVIGFESKWLFYPQRRNKIKGYNTCVTNNYILMAQ